MKNYEWAVIGVYVLVVGACSVDAFAAGMWAIGIIGLCGVVGAIWGGLRLAASWKDVERSPGENE